MCCRTTIAVNKDELEAYYRATFNNDFKATYNAAPSQLLPVLREPHKIELAKWGFLPKWMKDKRPQGLFNARSETVFEKPSFKHSIMTQRCLVPVTGYYEWQGVKGNRQPYYIRHNNQNIFSLAGLWQEWLDENQNSVFTYTILTTSPNKLLAEIHERMPVIIDKQNENTWLDYSINEQKINQLFEPFPDKNLSVKPISTLVNDVKNNSQNIIKSL